MAGAMLVKMAVHEVDHALGLGHSEDSAIISSYLNLSWNDLIRIDLIQTNMLREILR